MITVGLYLFSALLLVVVVDKAFTTVFDKWLGLK